MDDVQGGHVLVLLAQDEEQSVEEFRELTEVIPPTRVCHLFYKHTLAEYISKSHTVYLTNNTNKYGYFY